MQFITERDRFILTNINFMFCYLSCCSLATSHCNCNESISFFHCSGIEQSHTTILMSFRLAKLYKCITFILDASANRTLKSDFSMKICESLICSYKFDHYKRPLIFIVGLFLWHVPCNTHTQGWLSPVFSVWGIRNAHNVLGCTYIRLWYNAVGNVHKPHMFCQSSYSPHCHYRVYNSKSQ